MNSINTDESELYSSIDETRTTHEAKYQQALFDKWYSHYPKKVGKAAAQAAFRKIIKTEPLDMLIDAVELHKTSAQWTRDNGQFIPNPATWLNQRRWEDEVVVAANQSRTHDPVGYSDDPEEARRQLNADLEKLAKGEL